MPPKTPPKKKSGASSSNTPTFKPLEETIEFSVDQCTAISFTNLIATIQRISTGQNLFFGLRALVDYSEDTSNYFLLKMWDRKGYTIFLIFEKSSLYILGYKAENLIWYFSDKPKRMFEGFFPEEGNEFFEIRYRPAYTPLETKSSVKRGYCPLGFGIMSKRIPLLFDMKHSTVDHKYLARSFLIFIQMFSEAARLQSVYDEILEIATPIQGDDGLIYGEYTPSSLFISSENHWGKMSDALRFNRNLEDIIQPEIQLSSLVVLKKVKDVLRHVRIINSDLGGVQCKNAPDNKQCTFSPLDYT